jgi:hypothetical protein
MYISMGEFFRLLVRSKYVGEAFFLKPASCYYDNNNSAEFVVEWLEAGG